MRLKILVTIPDQKLLLETDLSTPFFFYVLPTSRYAILQNYSSRSPYGTALLEL